MVRRPTRSKRPDTHFPVPTIYRANPAAPSDAVRIPARNKGKVIASTIIRGNRQGVLKIPNARLWSPDDPYLYDLTAELVKVTPPKGAGNDRPGLPPMTGREVQAYAAATVTGASSASAQRSFGVRKHSTGIDPKNGKHALVPHKNTINNH